MAAASPAEAAGPAVAVKSGTKKEERKAEEAPVVVKEEEHKHTHVLLCAPSFMAPCFHTQFLFEVRRDVMLKPLS